MARWSVRARDQSVELSSFQKHVLSRVEDAYVRMWFNAFMSWPRDTRAEALGPVMNRIGAYAGDSRAKAVLGQRESTVVFSDILRDGIILLVSTASGTIGSGPAALMGGTIVSLFDSALRNQERLPPEERKKSLLIADEFQTITGTNWESMLAEVRKYKCSLMLATQSLAVLDTPDRNLKSGIMSNTACLISYQISAEDAQLVSYQMGHERVTETDLVMLDPFCCYVRITTNDKSLPVFSLKTLPPPEIEHGSNDSVEAVVENMMQYTVDRPAALKRINDEALEAMQGLEDKITTSGKTVSETRSTDPVPEAAAASSGVVDSDAPPRPTGNSVNPYATFIPGANDVPASSPRNKRGKPTGVEAVRDLLDEKVLKDSAFTVEVLGLLYDKADDPGVRVVIDKRLQGRVSHAFRDRENEFGGMLQDKDKEIEELRAQLDLALRNVGNSGSASVSDSGVGVVVADEKVVEPDVEAKPEPAPQRPEKVLDPALAGMLSSNPDGTRSMNKLRRGSKP